MVGSGLEARFPDTFSSITANCLICAAVAVLRWSPFCLNADADGAGWDSPGSRGDLGSLLDWVWGQGMREGSHHERLLREELKLASAGTSSTCSQGSPST